MRDNGLPVSLQEYLALMESLEKEVVEYNIDDFYYLCKTIFVKQEAHLDRFDIIFGHYFQGLEKINFDFFSKHIPEEWLKENFYKNLTDEEKAEIEAMGGIEKLMERFQELLEEQKKRHEGGNKWIGTGGTSPFGANGYNPEGFRIGQSGSRNRRAIKVWDKREFANLDDKVELDTRNMKLALKRLRRFAREGIEDELNLKETIRKTSENAGMLEISMQPEKKNKVKVLLLMDVGGSMDDHIEVCQRMFSASKYEFKHLEYFYFHNCLYETVWKDNTRRYDRLKTFELLRKYNKDYKVIFIGDAAMSPYELMSKSGSVEHYNDEAGVVWLQRVLDHFENVVWINPNDETSWNYYQTTHMIRDLFGHKMFPMTIDGITNCMKCLKNSKLIYSP